jgi:hypothetical protein
MSKTGDPTLQTTHLQTMRRVRNAVTVTATEIAPLAAIGVMERGEPTAGGWRLSCSASGCWTRWPYDPRLPR